MIDERMKIRLQHYYATVVTTGVVAGLHSGKVVRATREKLIAPTRPAI